jgi:Tol biopolymer transport system component
MSFIALICVVAMAACAPAVGVATPEPSATIIPTTSALAPSVSPSAPAAPGELIAVVEGRDDGTDEVIQLVRPSGGLLTTIPRPGVSSNEAPAWIPGSAALLFDSSRDGAIHLFRFDVTTGTVSQLTHGTRFEGIPAVSPDGRLIAFDYGTETTSFGISLMDADGSNIRTLVPPPDAPAYDSAPAFSPDGTRIAFIRKLSQTAPNAKEAAFVVNLDGTGLRQLTDWDLDVGRIRWSPDGARLAFSDKAENHTDAGSQDVWLINADGTGLTNVTRNGNGYHTFDPDWSPDGSRLVVLEWHVGVLRHINMVSMKVDGSDPRPAYASRDGWFLEWPTWGLPMSP